MRDGPFCSVSGADESLLHLIYDLCLCVSFLFTALAYKSLEAFYREYYSEYDEYYCEAEERDRPSCLRTACHE